MRRSNLASQPRSPNRNLTPKIRANRTTNETRLPLRAVPKLKAVWSRASKCRPTNSLRIWIHNAAQKFSTTWVWPSSRTKSICRRLRTSRRRRTNFAEILNSGTIWASLCSTTTKSSSRLSRSPPVPRMLPVTDLGQFRWSPRRGQATLNDSRWLPQGTQSTSCNICWIRRRATTWQSCKKRRVTWSSTCKDRVRTGSPKPNKKGRRSSFRWPGARQMCPKDHSLLTVQLCISKMRWLPFRTRSAMKRGMLFCTSLWQNRTFLKCRPFLTKCMRRLT